MNIVFLVPEVLMAPFRGDTVFKRPLGGTQTSITFLAKALADKGHNVCVVGADASQKEPECYSGVLCCPKTSFRPSKSEVAVHINEVWRDFLPYATVNILWRHLPGVSYAELIGIDKVVCLSEFHKQGMVGSSLRPEDCAVIHYGVDISYFSGVHHQHRLIYHSVPNRGLSFLLNWLPDLLKIDPEIKLVVCSGWNIYWDDKKIIDDLPEVHREPWPPDLQRNQKIGHPNVEFVGAVPLPLLCERLSQAWIHVYPCCKPDETFSLAVLLSQAAGLPVVTSKIGGLLDSASNQILIDFSNGIDGSYKDRFLGAVEKLLYDMNFWEMYHRRAERFAAHHSWEEIVGEWENLFKEELTAK